MKTRDELLAILRREKERLCRQWPISGLSMFGSVARGEATPQSDVDILVDINGRMGLRFVTLADELERLLGERVDLVSRRAIRPEVWALIAPEVLDV